MNRTYVALDLELTGLDPVRDDIIEVGLVKFRDNEVLDKYASLVRTSRRLPLKIERMVGIAPNELRDAPPFEAIQARITRLMGSHPVVGHGIDTDISFLSRYGLTPPHQIIDTFELASILVPEARRYTLSHLAKHMGIAHPNAHRALDDAMAAKDLFLALLERLANWDLALIREVADSVDADAWPLKALLEDVLQNAPLNLRQAGAPRG